jgi:hypothetical protein
MRGNIVAAANTRRNPPAGSPLCRCGVFAFTPVNDSFGFAYRFIVIPRQRNSGRFE